MECSGIVGKIANKLKNKKILYPLLGVLIGGGMGFAYYYFIGCNSGTCPITSSPWGSITMGSLIGLVLTVKQPITLLLNKNATRKSSHFLFYSYFQHVKADFLSTCYKQKTRVKLPSFFWRRKRDSNPRTCYSQRFSRPPHSTALPFLRGQKYSLF